MISPNMAPQSQTGVDSSFQFNQFFMSEAYKAIESQASFLLPSVMSLKVLEADATQAKAIGFFIVLQNDMSFFVPVVMNNSAIEFLDIIYAKILDVFLPLTQKWFDILLRLSSQKLGTSSKPLDSSDFDVDISSLVRPPNRYKYIQSSLKEKVASAIHCLSDAEKDKILSFMEKNAVFKQYIEKNYKNELVKVSESNYNIEVLDRDASYDDLYRCFGNNTKQAFQKIAEDGIVITGKEEGSEVLKVEENIKIEEPSSNGLYKILFDDASVKPSLVCMDRHKDGYANGPTRAGYRTKHYKILHEMDNGDLVLSRYRGTFVTETLSKEDLTGSLKKIFDGSFTPVKDDLIIFVDTKNLDIVPPSFRLDKAVSIDGDEKYFDSCSLAVTLSSNVQKAYSLNDTYVYPKSVKAVVIKKEEYDKSLPFDTKFITDLLLGKISDKLEKVIQFKKEAGAYYINGTPYFTKKEASLKLMKEFNLSSRNALSLLKEKKATWYTLKKEAQDPAMMQQGMDPAMMQQMMAMQGQGQMPMDPSMMQGMQDPSMMQGMDPSMMQGQMPMDPSMMQGMDPSMMQGMQDPSMMQGMNPEMMNPAMALRNEELMDSSFLSELIKSPSLKETVDKYINYVVVAIDSLARILLDLRIKKNILAEELGESTLNNITSNLKSTFTGLGETALLLNQDTNALRPAFEKKMK